MRKSYSKLLFIIFIPLCLSAFPDKKRDFNLPAEYTTTPSLVWARPLARSTIKILAIAPRASSSDFIELSKKLDCDIEVIYAEDSFNLGCDPLWGRWCPEDRKITAVVRKINESLGKNYELIIIAGVDLTIIPPEVWEKILAKVKEGKSLLLIPYKNPMNHPIAELVRTLEQIEEPVKKWSLIATGDPANTNRIKGDIYLRCSKLEDGRIVYLENYLDGMQTHCLIPDFVRGENLYLSENGWAGIISLILWSIENNKKGEIIEINEGAPPEPREEEIPPDLLTMENYNLSQPVLGSGLTPFRLKYQVVKRQKINRVRVRIRREGYLYSYEEYEFKVSPQKEKSNEVFFELPIGSLNYFADVWLLENGKVVDFISRRFTHTGYPSVESISLSKKAVYPHDSIIAEVTLSPSPLGRNEGCIVAQVYDLIFSPLFPEGRLVGENVVDLPLSEEKFSIPIRFAYIEGNFIRIKFWGLPFKVNKLGNNYSSLFSLKSIDLPVLHKVRGQMWNCYFVVNEIDELNQENYLEKILFFSKGGIYTTPKTVLSEPTRNLGCSIILEIWKEKEVVVNTSEGIRTPCVNDEEYIERCKNEIRKVFEEMYIPSPYRFSLGLSCGLTDNEVVVCFCDECKKKYAKLFLNGNDHLTFLKSKNEDQIQNDMEVISPEVLNYRVFMVDSFINFMRALKDICSTNFPNIPTGFSITPGKEVYTGANYGLLLSSFDWLGVEPTLYSICILPNYPTKKAELYLNVRLFDPTLDDKTLSYLLWRSLLEGFQGILIQNSCIRNDKTYPVNLTDNSGSANPALKGFYRALCEIQNSGMSRIFPNLKQDYNEDIGFYLSHENLEISNCIPEFDYKNAVLNLMRVINGFKVNPIIITKNNIGKINSIKILFIPSALYMSTDEIECISQYLEKGVVVADYLPGVVNETDSQLAIRIRECLKNEILNPKTSENGSSLNMFLLGNTLSQKWENIPTQKLIEVINSVKEALNRSMVKTVYGEEIGEWIDAKFYSYDKGRIIAIFPNINPMAGSKKIRIAIEKDSWIYDISSGNKFKKFREFKINTEKVLPSIFSTLPYQVKEIRAKYPESSKAGERIPIEVRLMRANSTEDGNFVKHKILIKLASDEEMMNTIHTEMVETDEEGKAFTTIPTYLNQPAGWYFVLIEDFYTGTSKTCLVKIIQ